MNKEQVLAQSRKENEVQDERARYLEQRGASFSVGVLVVLWVLISRLAPLDDAAQCSMGLLVTASCLSSQAYQLIKGRTKTALAFTLLFLIATGFYLVMFLKTALHLF